MRTSVILILSIIVGFPAYSAARLPVVNLSSAGVSARAAFGESVSVAQIKNIPTDSGAEIITAPRVAIATPAPKKTMARADVLSPMRPSSDLWARNDNTPSQTKNNYKLPEEKLPEPKKLINRSAQLSPAKIDAPTLNLETRDMDTEIAKLVELQKRADENARAARKPTMISSYNAPVKTLARAPEIPAAIMDTDSDESDAAVPIVRRVVIPMDDDILVRPVKTDDVPKFTNDAELELAKMSPGELKKAFKKTYMSENKHLSTYKIDDRFDEASDVSVAAEGFVSTRDLSESGGVRPLEIKIGFRGNDSALSRDNYNLLSEYAGVVVTNPKRAIQISIPERETKTAYGRKLAARRLAIIEQVLRDTGVSDARIIPVLASRADESFILRVISSDQFETMTQQKRDMFGDSVGKKTYKSMTW